MCSDDDGVFVQIEIKSVRKRSAHRPLSFSIMAGNMSIGDFTQHLLAILEDLQVSRVGDNFVLRRYFTMKPARHSVSFSKTETHYNNTVEIENIYSTLLCPMM